MEKEQRGKRAINGIVDDWPGSDLTEEAIIEGE